MNLIPFKIVLFRRHTARDVALTPDSSAGILHVEVPSAGLSRPFECCPQFQDDDLWGGIWVLVKGRSHMDSDQVSMVAAEPLKYLFWPKICSQRWQCDGALSWCSIQVSANFLHAQFEGQNFVDDLEIQIQHTTDHSDCETSIRPHEIPHFGHIFVRFWCARSSRTRFVFHTLTAIQKCFMPPKNLCPW